MKKTLKCIGWILLILVILVAAGVGVLTIAEYRPADRETVIEPHAAEASLKPGDSLTLVTWNLGYGALGDNADFFMDGGTGVYTADRDRVAKNLAGIRETLASMDADIILMQEVDIHSDRSYGTDERTSLDGVIPGAYTAFAYNFKALYVPYPLPMIGHVESGLYTVSRPEIRTAERVSLPCPFAWPIRTVNLKRGLLVSRIPLQDTDRELVIVNLHLEAYDSGEGKEAQTRALLDVILPEAAAGNYVIAGGDFNQRFSNIDSGIYPLREGLWQPGVIDVEDFAPDFTLLMDPETPTCRSLDKPYAGENPAGFQFYMIDGYIVSANVRVESVETVDCGFVNTDHNPVRLRVTLAEADEAAGE